jgi:hypothetical protein
MIGTTSRLTMVIMPETYRGKQPQGPRASSRHRCRSSRDRYEDRSGFRRHARERGAFGPIPSTCPPLTIDDPQIYLGGLHGIPILIKDVINTDPALGRPAGPIAISV